MSSENIAQSDLVDRAMSAFRWVATLRFLGQLISWLSTIFVIRFLAPEDYGVIALAEVFRTFFLLFSNVGFSQGLIKVEHLPSSLIRKTLGLLVSINVLLMAIQFTIAPYVAAFYENPDLEIVLRVLAFTYLLVPWSAVPGSLISRNLDHKKASQVRLVSDVLAACLSLTLAYLGYGYWALVAAIVFTAVSNCVLLNFIINYPRIPSFRFQGTRELFAFGAFVSMSEILFVAYNRVDVAIAGRFFDTAQIGLYGVAIQLAIMLMVKSVPLVNNVAFPAFARMNAIAGNSNDYLLTSLRFTSIFVFPLFLGMAMVAHEMIGLLLGSKWLPITGMFIILVVSVPLRVLAYIISPAILAAGGARLNMLNSFITLVVLTAAIFALIPFGILGVAVAWSLASVCIFLLALIRGGRLLSISQRAFVDAFAPAMLVAVAMCAVLFVFEQIFPDPGAIYGLYKVPLGMIVYFTCFWVFFRHRSEEVIHVVLRIVGRRANTG